jgi:hypothetical protein
MRACGGRYFEFTKVTKVTETIATVLGLSTLFLLKRSQKLKSTNTFLSELGKSMALFCSSLVKTKLVHRF